VKQSHDEKRHCERSEAISRCEALNNKQIASAMPRNDGIKKSAITLLKLYADLIVTSRSKSSNLMNDIKAILEMKK